jgi:hypothetical protein
MFAHIDGRIIKLQNEDNSLITNTHEDLSMDAPILNMLNYSFSSSKANPSIRTIIWAWTIGFNCSKSIIRRGMTSFTSYLIAK